MYSWHRGPLKSVMTNRDRNGDREASEGLSAARGISACLTADELDHLLARMQPRKFRRGDFVFRASDPDQNVYFLQRGRIKLYRLSEEGREIIMRFCVSGELFGLIDTVRGTRRVISAQASDDSEVFVMANERFQEYLENHGKLAIFIMTMFSRRVNMLGDLLTRFISGDVNARILWLIKHLADRHGVPAGNDVEISIPLTHQEIANMAGTTRQTVTSVLTDLRRRNIVSLENQHICVRYDLLEKMIGDHAAAAPTARFGIDSGP